MNVKKVVGSVVFAVAAVVLFVFLKNNVFKKEFYYAGTLEATRVIVPSRLSSQISKFDVKAGDRVEAGQIIAQLDDSELQISLKRATSQYNRRYSLYKSGNFSKSDLEILEAEKNSYELKIKWSTISSPISGIVLAKYKESGEWITQGAGLVSIADIKNIYTYFYVEHDKVASLKIGDKVKCFLPEIPNKEFTGKITVISSEPEFTPKNVQTRSERTRLVYGIRVDLENNNEVLKPGMTIETQFK